MIKRTYLLRFERYKVGGSSPPSWRVIETRGFFKPNFIQIVNEIVESLERDFPDEDINLVEFKQI